MIEVARARLPGLLDEPPISFYPSLAARTGVNKALILQQIHFLCRQKQQAGDEYTFKDGIHWVYNTVDQWVERYFQWLSANTLKRLLRELEIVEILLTMDSEQDGRSKWYAINYARWESWFAETTDDDQQRIKMIRKSGSKRSLSAEYRDQNDPESRDQNDPDYGSDRDQNDPVLYIYKESETPLSETPLFTENLSSDLSTTHSSSESESMAPAPLDDDEFMRLVQDELSVLEFNPVQRTLLIKERGLIYALALAWHTKKHARTSFSGFAIKVMGNGGPPDELLERASYAVELRTVNASEIDRHIRHQDLATLSSQVVTFALSQDHEPEQAPQDKAEIEPFAEPETAPIDSHESSTLVPTAPAEPESALDRWRAAVAEHSAGLGDLTAQVLDIKPDRNHGVEWVTIAIDGVPFQSDAAREFHRRLRELNAPELFRLKPLTAEVLR